MANPSLPNLLARSFLAGEPSLDQIVSRCTQVLGRRWLWLRPLAQRYLETTTSKTRPRQREVADFILRDPVFSRIWSERAHTLAIEQWLPAPSRMAPVPAARAWDIPLIDSPAALADFLWLDYAELDWFADLKKLTYKTAHPRLRHYYYRVLTKQSGGVRLIEAPKRRLKRLQREILAGILEKIPPHPAVHGFFKGRSIRTFVAPHVGRRVVLRMDLRDFFVSFGAARIQAFFRTLGYPESVADLLGGICTNAVPRHVWHDAGSDIDPAEFERVRSLYSRPHLPQGAPTSPALANLCAYRLDCRLAGLAKSAGVTYTRYADDLAFSGGSEFEKHVERFSTHVAAIALEEGFSVHHRKTRIMRRGVRQHLAGVVTNERINILRADFDRLKATLTNCVRHGPASQNRTAHPSFRAHLDGRVAFVETINPERGKRLRTLFEQIDWR
ncbi:MAG: RNA-directed DNA polymerase [Acidobacteriaceae bacterium]|nr:RNA-directed DNA polymerase [Acidobacteriaceae bacterium]